MPSSATPSGAACVVDYDGRRFQPVGHESSQAGTEIPVGQYHQDGDLVWAEFSGADLRVGRLVGTCLADGVIDAAYCLITTDGQAVAGSCVSTPTLQPDRSVRLTEHWRRLDGSTGISHLVEITA
jgi:hypothetical protein